MNEKNNEKGEMVQEKEKGREKRREGERATASILYYILIKNIITH